MKGKKACVLRPHVISKSTKGLSIHTRVETNTAHFEVNTPLAKTRKVAAFASNSERMNQRWYPGLPKTQ